jgi:hypothetical protein
LVFAMADEKKVTLKVTFPTFEETPAVYANHVTVQFLGGEFLVGLYAVFPPIRPDSEVSDVIEVPAKCVARVTVPKDRMRDILRVLNESVHRALPSDAEGEVR